MSQLAVAEEAAVVEDEDEEDVDVVVVVVVADVDVVAANPHSSCNPSVRRPELLNQT